jgi:dephospho-CoA kinase
MKTIGVTGGIGSGKSEVCRLLEELGARVIGADEVARRLMHEDPELRAAIVEAFGPESYDAGGQLNRAHLAALVFNDRSRIEQLNALVHPRVASHFEEQKRLAERDGVDLLVKEAALIFESGAHHQLDAVVVVDAPLEERIRRVTLRDGVTREQVEARMRNQLAPEELRRRASHVIENHGDRTELRRQVEELYRRLVG